LPAGVEVRELSLKGDGAALDLSASQKGTRWDVAGASLRWGPFALKASGSADTGGRGALDMKVHLDPASLSELAKLAPAAGAYKPTGTVSADVTVKGTPAAPAPSGRVTLSGAGAETQGQKLSGVGGTVTLGPDSAAGALSGKLNGTAFEVKLDGKDLRLSPQLRVDAHIAKLDLAALPSGKKEEPKAGEKPAPAPKKAAPGTPFRLQGTFSAGAVSHPKFEAGAAKVVVDLRGAGSDIGSLDGTVSLRVGAGRFQDLRGLGSDKPLLKALLFPVILLQKTAALVKVPFFPRFDTFDFSSISGDYAIKAGVLTVRQSRLDGKEAQADLTGTADLVKGPLAMRAQVRLPRAGTVAFKVHGTVDQPAVSLDVKSLLEQPEVKKAVDKTLQQGVEMLKGLFH
ncbi:MAG: hypothetical protein KGL53_04315, partial [Elusimicrobia bacterium]|nr:hypothetical protein [Elusimicrobiota bacterium]